jgi:hypothetical protein
MLSKEDSITWLQRHMTRYHSERDSMGKVIEDFDYVRKLVHGFTSVDKLEEVNLSGEGDK